MRTEEGLAAEDHTATDDRVSRIGWEEEVKVSNLIDSKSLQKLPRRASRDVFHRGFDNASCRSVLPQVAKHFLEFTRFESLIGGGVE